MIQEKPSRDIKHLCWLTSPITNRYNMEVTRHKQILGLYIQKVPGIKLLSADQEVWEGLPEWIIDSSGHIVDPNEWKEDIKPDTDYLMTNVAYCDPILEEEVSNAGLSDIMKKVSLSPLLSKIPIHSPGDRQIPPVARIALEVIYTCGRGWEDMYDDCDVDIKLLGHIDENLQLIPC